MKIKNNIILLFSITALIFSACNKEKESQLVQNSNNETSWTQKDLEIQNKILAFQDKVKNNNFKSGEQLTIDEAIWNLEALMNFNYSNPDSSFVNLTIDSTFEFNLPINGEMVNFEDITNAAHAIEEHVINFLNNMPNSIKFIIAVDISLKDDEFKSGSKTLSISTGYGSEYIDNPAAYTPFGANDYWTYGFDLGGCQNNSATTSDAAEKIEFKINNPNYNFNDPYPAGSYVVNVGVEEVSAWDHPNPDDPGAPDNWLDCLMYHEVTNNILTADECLEPTEMNFYLQGTLDVIEVVINQKKLEYPNDNIEFVYLSLNGQMVSAQNIITYYHTADITFGKRVMKVPPID